MEFEFSIPLEYYSPALAGKMVALKAYNGHKTQPDSL